MKLAVFSDTHGRTAGMLRALAAERPDAVIHLGDHERDTRCVRETFPDLPLYSLSGNCDAHPQQPDTAQLTLAGVHILATHGHRYRVKLGLDALWNAGYFSGAGLVLFGHTHTALHEQREGVQLLNPGSAGVGAHCSYAVVELSRGKIVACALRPIPASTVYAP